MLQLRIHFHCQWPVLELTHPLSSFTQRENSDRENSFILSLSLDIGYHDRPVDDSDLFLNEVVLSNDNRSSLGQNVGTGMYHCPRTCTLHKTSPHNSWVDNRSVVRLPIVMSPKSSASEHTTTLLANLKSLQKGEIGSRRLVKGRVHHTPSVSWSASWRTFSLFDIFLRFSNWAKS